MFAVVDLHGRVVAFSGRALTPVKPGDEESPAKYYNSPESPIYQKRATVFGLYQARSSLRSGNPCVIVEGNFDVVSLHAKGFTQTVAPLGTAFTGEQGKLIRRFTNQLTLLFDGDRAGRKATSASREPAKDSGLTARVARLPDGMDPDDFSRERGAEGLKNLLGAASGISEYLINEILDDPTGGEGAAAMGEKVQRVTAILKAETDITTRALLEQKAATRLGQALGVGKGGNEATFSAISKSIRRELRTPELKQREPVRDDGYFPEDDQEAMPAYLEEAQNEPRSRLDESIVGAILDFPELLDSDEVLTYAHHMEGDLALGVACLREARISSAPSDTGSGTFQGDVLERLPGAIKNFVTQRLAAPLHEEVDLARVELCANLDKLRRMELSRHAGAAVGEIERARQEGDFDQELELLRAQEKRARAKRGL